jgi:hypothetical protein
MSEPNLFSLDKNDTAVKPIQSHHDNEHAVPCDTSKNGRSLAALKGEQSRSGDSSQVDESLPLQPIWTDYNYGILR